MLIVIMGLVGLLAGGIINALADCLPEREPLARPRCSHCHTSYPLTGWLALSRSFLYQGKCPACGQKEHWRGRVLEISTVGLFTILPLFITHPITLVVTAFYTAVLLLIIVIDLEHRLILHVVTFPVTLLALLLTFINPDNNLLLAVTGAAAGFISFFLLYQLGILLFGPGALGFGDVTLAMTMGAMLGLHRIIFALIIGIVLGGIISLFILLIRRSAARSYLPYGQYLATGGIVMLIWGNQILAWYIGSVEGG